MQYYAKYGLFTGIVVYLQEFLPCWFEKHSDFHKKGYAKLVGLYFWEGFFLPGSATPDLFEGAGLLKYH